MLRTSTAYQALTTEASRTLLKAYQDELQLIGPDRSSIVEQRLAHVVLQIGEERASAGKPLLTVQDASEVTLEAIQRYAAMHVIVEGPFSEAASPRTLQPDTRSL